MNTQSQYIKIALFIGLGLLVLITCIGSYMLYTMEYDESVPVHATNVPQGQNTPSQNQVVSPLPDGTMPVAQAGTATPPPPPLPEGLPSLEEMQARYAQHEAEGVAIPKTYPVQTEGVMTPEEALKKFGGGQTTPQ